MKKIKKWLLLVFSIFAFAFVSMFQSGPNNTLKFLKINHPEQLQDAQVNNEEPYNNIFDYYNLIGNWDISTLETKNSNFIEGVFLLSPSSLTFDYDGAMTANLISYLNDLVLSYLEENDSSRGYWFFYQNKIGFNFISSSENGSVVDIVYFAEYDDNNKKYVNIPFEDGDLGEFTFSCDFNNVLITYPIGEIFAKRNNTTITYNKLIQYGAEKNNSYNEGYEQGYDEGHLDGLEQGRAEKDSYGISPFVQSIFNGFGTMLSVEIFPHIKIWYVIGIPLIFGIVKFVIGWFK